MISQKYKQKLILKKNWQRIFSGEYQRIFKHAN